MKRRHLLVAAPGLLMQARLQDAPVPLRVAARSDGLLIGSSSEIDLARDPAYARLIASNATLFAPNISWQRMSPTPDATLAGLDANIAWARRAGLHLTGYHLLWHQRLPTWFDALDRSAAERAIVDHIGTLGAQFGPDTFAWNVVNEAIRPADGLPGGLRRSPLLEKFGTRFFDLAFETARAVQPSVIRMYNDYGLELDTSDERARRRALLGLLDELAARSVPIQAIGLQSHLRTRSFDRFDAAGYRRFLTELTDRGLDVVITELDVHDLTPGDLSARDAQVAGIYKRFLDTVLSEPRLRAIVFWGLSDRYSWLNDPARPDELRPDGQAGRSAPFDDDMRPKVALTAIEQALRDAPRHRTQR